MRPRMERRTPKASGDAKDEKETAKEVKFVPNFPPVKDKMVTRRGKRRSTRSTSSSRKSGLANQSIRRRAAPTTIHPPGIARPGRPIATEAEIKAYMDQPADTRRSWLVEKLLASPEFGENFANIWTVMMLTRTGSMKTLPGQMRDWLTERFNSDIGPDK